MANQGHPDSPATVEDLMRVTGLGRATVREGIRRGELPGFQVGARGQYVVPRQAFEAFCRGEWEPRPRRMFAEPVAARERVRLLHRKGA